jgi:mono/diheme cytochrome c family protein
MRISEQTRKVAVFTVAGLLGVATFAWAAKDPIHEAMEKYHKGKEALCKKVGAGKASKEELTAILAAYKAMAAAKPPKGDMASWKEKSSALVAATQLLVDGKPEGLAKYKEAVNCKACHSIHKPD